jgi:hypothetical protein
MSQQYYIENILIESGVIPVEMDAARQGANQTNTQMGNQIAGAAATADLSSKLILISSIINNLNTATDKEDSLYVVAATIGLIASYLSKVAAIQEAKEQQVAPGVTTFANNLKLIAASIGLISSAISYWALLIEVTLRAQGISAPQTPGAAGNTAVSGSLLVQ